MRKLGTKTVLAALAAVFAVPVVAFAQDLPEPGALALHAASQYRKQARYPADSKVLPAGAEDPIRAKRTANHITTRGRDGEVTSLAIWSAKVSYEAGAPIEFFALGAGSDVLAVTGEIVAASGERVGTFRFFDDGVGADAAPGDGVYSARALLHKKYLPDLAEVYRVPVQASFANGETRTTLGGFLYSNPWARLTGRYRDRAADGSLVVSAQVRVERAGRFHLAGTLHTLDGEPIGTSQAALELEPGKHWIDLPFYGLMFHDRQVRGPYRLGSLALTTASGMPNAFADLAEDVHLTRAVPLKRLTARPAGDAALLRAAEVLEAEAARSRGVATKN